MLLVLLQAHSTAWAAENAPEPSRVEEISKLLPPEPRGVGRPIADREAWGAMASRPGFQEIVRQAEEALSRPIPAMTDDVYLDYSRTGNRRRGERVISERHGRFALLALAECLENRGRFLGPFEAAVREVASEKSWLLPAHDGGLENFQGKIVQIDLHSSASSWSLATAAWWLREKLSAPIRDLIASELERRTFQPFEGYLATGAPQLWWPTTTNNWNAVCLAGVNGAAQAAIESPRRRAFFVAASEKLIRHFLSGFTPDGYCSEGLGYWNYGFGHYVLLAETILQATGGKIDLFRDPAVPAIARFGNRMEILPGVYPAFADCSPGARPDPRLAAFLRRKLGIPAEGVERGVLRRPTLSLPELGVYAFPGSSVETVAVGAAPKAKDLRDWFPDAGILICRPAPGGRSAIGAALKGGHNDEHHNHNDVGSFVVALAGETPLLDPGAEVYTARTFSSRRYESNVINSFGHPVPRVAGKLQQTGRRAAARIVSTRFGEKEDVLVLDIRSAYPVPELEKLERTFAFSREGGGRLTVTDDAEFKSPQEFETALITLLPWRSLDGKNRLAVGSGPGAVAVTADAGEEELTVEAVEIKEDTHGKPPTRLGLKLGRPVTRVKVRLEITPLEQSENPKK